MTTISVSEAKVQLRLEPEFTEHDEHIESLAKAAKRSIERSYSCQLVSSQDEVEALDGDRAFIADDDIKLAMKMMVARWYFDPTGANTAIDTPSQLGVEYLLFPLMEHGI
ncbi:phage gp6-like head-tail connector protein [Pectobacterium aroidearum]|uniref:Phage gp6-like head-tail connector protein n=1 Tax=Pectobacterium aroidearum TaxID=1201031 RepID=A0ABR5ZJU2_9GAMM|nr:head-tail connector protein [Pectobacterium aroidearum]MBA5234758.1 phage gp6-like head-tail connector protein [Pectobacterium aroidearum]MBA5739937.1 phage gp6-like head-tail connector protein [Pectobacterium aroidearum]